MKTLNESSVQTTEITLPTQLGFHLRVVARFVKCVSQFHSVIFVRKGNVKANGKSIMGLLLLAAAWKSKLYIEAEGDDAEQAIEGIKSFFQTEET
jgi:phosphotransferase system HPr (HPr) family protein